MTNHTDRQQNHQAFRGALASIGRQFAPGRFVAIFEGRVIADADQFDELRAALVAQGKDPAQVLIVQAGQEYPESAIIFWLGIHE